MPVVPSYGRQLGDRRRRRSRLSWKEAFSWWSSTTGDGTDSEYIGAGGCCNLGRVMALDGSNVKRTGQGRISRKRQEPVPRMTVLLQWWGANGRYKDA